MLIHIRYAQEGVREQPSFPPPHALACFKQILLLLLLRGGKSEGTFWRLSRAVDLSLPNRDWHILHPETRNVCRGCEQSGRSATKRRQKGLKVSVLRKDHCLGSWGLSQEQRTQWHLPRGYQADSKQGARRKHAWRPALMC